MLNMISDGAFYFMPVLLAYGAAIKFQCSPILAMTPIATTQLTKTGSEMINGPGMLASNVAQGATLQWR